jgi:uncharacterized LabA/DUF88 family protein
MPTQPKTKPIYAFIDAANLFYGGKKSLGWKIDYKKLLNYKKGDASLLLLLKSVFVY